MVGLGLYYAFKIAFYAFEQCSKIFPIMPQLCSIVPYYMLHCALLCSISSFKVLLPEFEDKHNSLTTTLCLLVRQLDIIFYYYDWSGNLT